MGHETMTVAELIATLRRLDPTLPVVVYDTDGNGWTKVWQVWQTVARLDPARPEVACVVVE